MTALLPTLPPIPARAWPALAAATLPSLLAWNLSPSPTVLNQALALLLWGLFVAVALAASSAASSAAPSPATAAAQPHGAPRRRGLSPLHATLGALALMAGAVAWSWGPGALPSTLALSALGLLAAAAVMVGAGAAMRQRADAEALFAAVAWGLLAAGLLNVGIAAVQVFAPALADGSLIARSGLPGRAVGNLRQPNHLSSLLLWACIAAVVLVQTGRLRPRWGAAAGLALVGALVLTASRTGLLSVLLLALWGAADGRLAGRVRAALGAAPLAYALVWGAMAGWAALTAHSFGGSARLAETDISSSRFDIWANTLALIGQHPWTGVGWGQFNFAWTLTPFPGRPVALFDHTHSLPLQLAVELGLPLAALVLGLLAWALWRGARGAWAAADEGQNGGGDEPVADMACRGAVLAVLMIGLHSLLEYPLWYAYFLLPTAWLWGFAVAGRPGAVRADASSLRSPTLPPRALAAAGAALALGGALVAADYSRVARIFIAGSQQPLAQRVAAGQRSVFFGHHADYALVTSGLPSTTPERDFRRATHYLLDTRLMLAWARTRAALGDEDGARHLAARLREFGNPGAKAYFAPCDGAAASAAGAAASSTAPASPLSPASPASAPPLQCQAPQHSMGWRDFAGR